jgi:hypothetical protein
MGRGIGVGNVAVPSAPNNIALAHDDRADRHFFGVKGTMGAAQGFFHPKLVWFRWEHPELISAVF